MSSQRVVLTGGPGAGKTTLLKELRARGEAVYANDNARDRSFAEAVRVHEAMVRWYRRCRYEVVEVPRLTVAERCEHVLSALAASGA